MNGAVFKIAPVHIAVVLMYLRGGTHAEVFLQTYPLTQMLRPSLDMKSAQT